MVTQADTQILIGALEAKRAAEKETTLEGKLRSAMSAMSAMKNHWMLLDEDTQFRVAIGGVLLLTEGEEKQRIEDELNSLKILSSAMRGVPVNWGQVQAPKNPIGLMKMWREMKKEA